MGGPYCWQDSGLCEDKKCRYWVDQLELGNCVKRCDRQYSLEACGVAIGGVTRERARQIEAVAMDKLRKSEVLKEIFEDLKRGDYEELQGMGSIVRGLVRDFIHHSERARGES